MEILLILSFLVLFSPLLPTIAVESVLSPQCLLEDVSSYQLIFQTTLIWFFLKQTNKETIRQIAQ